MGNKPAYTFPEGVVGLDKAALANRLRADLLTPEEFAAMLDVSLHTIESWRKKGRGPGFVRLERRVYYRLADVREWIADNVTSPNAHSDLVGGVEDSPAAPGPGDAIVAGTIAAPKIRSTT